MIFATYSITDTRKERVAFAGPYFVAGQDLLVRQDDTDDHRTRGPQRQDPVLGDRFDLGPEDQGHLRRGVNLHGAVAATPTASAGWRPAAHRRRDHR